MGLIVVESGTILITPDICWVIISLHVLGANGGERHVCEIAGRHGLGRTKSSSSSVSKVYWVVEKSSQHTNGGGVRKPSKGTSIALWWHEFYAVFSTKSMVKAAKSDISMYQALEFRMGSFLQVECRDWLSEKECSDGIIGKTFEARKGSHDKCVKSEVGTVFEGEKGESCSVSKVLWVVS
jgi:hypothetical protein